MEDYIYDHGGDLLSTVTSNIEALIVGSIIESSKVQQAQSLNVPIYTVPEFIAKYNVKGVKLSKITVDFTEE